MRTIRLVFLFMVMSHTLFASQYPVDLSFMVADLKYSEEEGVKICEVQHGILSTFRGDGYLNGGNPAIAEEFSSIISQFYEKSWAVQYNISEQDIRSRLERSDRWVLKLTIEDILKDADFLRQSQQSVEDSFDLASYHGFLFAPAKSIRDLKTFRKNYPGIVLMDAATHPFWIDKYKMSELFNNDPVLATFKPKWSLYPKRYSSGLAQQIREDLGTELFVIKPRGAFLGNGVIIVSEKDLDTTLKYILTKPDKLKKDPDRSYSYWYKDSFDSFLVEAFAKSDPIIVDEDAYHPTMRAAFILTYNRGEIQVDVLWGYWLLPYKKIGETGSLNELYKAYCKVPYFAKADDQVLEKVEEQLKVALPLLYRQMLEGGESND